MELEFLLMKNIQIPELNNIIMSQNFFVVPKRLFYFDFTNGLIKVKQYNPDKDFYDFYLFRYGKYCWY